MEMDGEEREIEGVEEGDDRGKSRLLRLYGRR